MRARVGVTESHREPERDRERQGEIQYEPERVSESLREASLTFLAYLKIVLLQNN